MDSPYASPRLRRVQHFSIGLATLACTLNYVDRATLAIANPLIRHELGFSIAEMGLLLSAFLWAYAACQLPAGALVDRFGPRRLLAAAIVVWSFAQILSGLVGGFWQFIAARILLGLGESPQFSGLTRIIRDWYNVRKRGLPTGIGQCGSKLGPAIAPMILTPLMLSFGWRWMFIVSGVAGIAIAAIWYTVYRDPGQVALTADERAYLLEEDGAIGTDRMTWADWRQLFSYRATWGVVIGVFGEAYMSWVYQTWLPGYLEIERHMSIAKAGWLSGLPFAFGVAGSIGSGLVTDLLTARGISPVNSCKTTVVIGLLGLAGFTVMAALASDIVVVMVSLSAALLFNGIAGAMCWALLSVIAPRRSTASLGGIQNCGGYIGASLAPVVTGFIVQDTGSFVPALLLGASLALVSALAYAFVVPAKPIDDNGGRMIEAGQ
jgi:MFS family permease